MRKKTSAVIKAEEGVVGADALWSGPMDTTGFPMIGGSSSGSNPVQVKKAPCMYKGGPITQIAKSARGE
jgi:hypothetical protein